MAGGITHGTSSMPRHLRWPRLGMLCTKCATMNPIERFEDDGGDGEDAGLPHHHPEGLALEQEQEIAEADEALHRLVEGGEMDGIEGGIEHQERDQQDQRQRHQECDRRFALHGPAQGGGSASAAGQGRGFAVRRRPCSRSRSGTPDRRGSRSAPRLQDHWRTTHDDSDTVTRAIGGSGRPVTRRRPAAVRGGAAAPTTRRAAPRARLRSA